MCTKKCASLYKRPCSSVGCMGVTSRHSGSTRGRAAQEARTGSRRGSRMSRGPHVPACAMWCCCAFL
eukprot:5005294-Alexandrium_andersonii.AAC.1